MSFLVCYINEHDFKSTWLWDVKSLEQLLVVCNHSRKIQMTKTLAAMRDDRNSKAH